MKRREDGDLKAAATHKEGATYRARTSKWTMPARCRRYKREEKSRSLTAVRQKQTSGFGMTGGESETWERRERRTARNGCASAVPAGSPPGTYRVPTIIQNEDPREHSRKRMKGCKILGVSGGLSRAPLCLWRLPLGGEARGVSQRLLPGVRGGAAGRAGADV